MSQTELIYFLFKKPITWRIPGQSDVRYSLPAFRDSTFINPILNPAIVPKDWGWVCNVIGKLESGEILVNSTAILLEVPNFTLHHTNSESFLNEFFDILLKLRWICSNGELPRYPKHHVILASNKFTIPTIMPEFVFSHHGSLGHMGDQYGKFNAPFPHDLITASTTPTPPAADMVLISAFECLSENDFEQSIIRSAKTLELIGRGYCDRLTAGFPSPEYEAFKQNSRDVIKTLFNKVPSDCSAPSLFQENSVLYGDSLALYKARNSYMHSFHFDPQYGYKDDRTSALKALRIATEVFSWTGHQKDFKYSLATSYNFGIAAFKGVRLPQV